MEKDYFDIVKTPDQMIADALSCRQEVLNDELESSSYFIKDAESWKVIYKEGSGYEENSARDDDVVALLRLAKGVVSLNKNPILLDHKQISLDSFFRSSIRDMENFGSLHTRMSYDPLLTCVVLAQLEEIFEIPVAEKVFTGIQAELTNRPDLDREIPSVSSSNKDVIDNSVKKRKSIKRKATAATMGVIATVSIAACSLISSSNESSEDTLKPMGNTSTTTNIDTSTTTLVLNNCEDFIIVSAGENITNIADKCGKTVEQIMLWNSIDNANLIKEGQVLRLIELESIPTTNSTTTQPELITTTTISPNTTVEATVPITADSTPIAPSSTTPVATTPLNDGVLSESQCIELGGFQHRFQSGEYLYNALQDIYGIQENQAATLLKKEIIDKYKLRQITASTPGQKGAECMPQKSEFINDLPAPIFTSNSTP